MVIQAMAQLLMAQQATALQDMVPLVMALRAMDQLDMAVMVHQAMVAIAAWDLHMVDMEVLWAVMAVMVVVMAVAMAV